jgi:hypothetical protein
MPRDELQEELSRLNADWLGLTATDAPDGDADLESADFSCFTIPSCRRCGGVLKPTWLSAFDLSRPDAVEFKIKTNNRVGVVFLRFADQRLDGLDTLGFARGGVDSAPTGGRLDAPD